MLSLRRTSKVAPHPTNLLEEPFTESNIVTQRRNERPPAFFLDPFICEAVNARGLYPPVPTREEFATRGLSLDSEGLKKAIRTLLSRADAPLSKESVYAGVGNVACFSSAVHKYLLDYCGDVFVWMHLCSLGTRGVSRRRKPCFNHGSTTASIFVSSSDQPRINSDRAV